MNIEQEIITALHKLNDDQQMQVLRVIQGLLLPRGTSGAASVQIARELAFPKDDLAAMQAAIEAWCERVDDYPEVDLDA
jgi:hypothetical protein